MKTWKLLLLCLALIVANNRAEAQVAHLTLASEPGDYIGQGQDYDIFYTRGQSDTVIAEVDRTVAGAPAEIEFVLDGPTMPSATLFFSTDQLGIPMQPGTYTDAQHAPFASPGHPGLDVSFDGRGSNTLTGQFTVTNFVYSPTAGIQSFAVSFEQHSEGAAPALYGTFTYAAVPEPGAAGWCICVSIAGSGLWVLRRAKRARVA